jgi:hypothetical protein
MISDGAHGGNPDFFFLPPLVSNPVNDPNYDRGKGNTALEASLTVEICQLDGSPVNSLGQPVDCVVGLPLVKKFAAGTGAVRLQGSGDDGFYMAQWKTQDSNLDVTKFYRIKVFVEGSTVPLGIADLDPMASMKEFKNARTGETIPLLDDSTLPIKFRVEKGALCTPGVQCNSVTVTNNDPSGFQLVTLDGGAGAIAGAKFPNNWLPTDGPQSVVVTISSVNTGASDPIAGTEAVPCHADLPLLQFRGCFNFITTPRLDPINGESGPQFAKPVTVAVCYVLQGSGDPREKFAEMYASGPNEQPHALDDASDVGILSPATRDCSSNVIGINNSEGVTGLASAGWAKMKAGLSKLFGVQTAYAVDLGLGGFISEFSNVGPALSAEIVPYTNQQPTAPPSTIRSMIVRVLGSNHHDGEHQNSVGLGGIPVTFTIAAGNGALRLAGNPNAAPATQLTVLTDPGLLREAEGTSGFAQVFWTLPDAAGTYTMTANGPTTGGPITYTTTVVPTNAIGLAPTEQRMLSMQTGASIQLGVTGPTGIASWISSAPSKVTVSPTGIVTAIVGGENIAGGDTSAIISTLTDGNVGPSLIVDSFGFDIFPRTTTLSWAPVAGALTYQIVTEFGNGAVGAPQCTVPADCGRWSPATLPITTTGLTTTISFIGAQPGRWRVTALNAAGGVISTSPNIYFAYTI